MSQRSNDLYGSITMVALIIIAAVWVGYVWEATTGVTVASRRHLGHNSTPEHLASTRRTAIGTTVVFGVVAGVCSLLRRSS
jgi:hypothetical protein